MIPPVAGYRLEALDRSPQSWVTVERVVVDEKHGLAHAVVAPLVRGDAAPGRFPLPLLTKPHRALHFAIVAKPAAERQRYWRRVASSLAESRVPVRVTQGDDGWYRAESSLRCAPWAATAPERVALDWTVAAWRAHLEKHVASDNGASYFESFLRRARIEDGLSTILEPWHVQRAWKRARAAPQPLESPLPAEWWPLAEIYACLTQELFCQMLSGPAVHVVRWELGSALHALPLGLDDELHIGPQQEVLYVAPFGSTLAVAKGDPDPSRPLGWSTTHRRDDIDGCLSSRVRVAMASPSCTVRAHDTGDDEVPPP